MSIPLKDGLQNQTLDRVLEDILVRFVINAPAEDLSSNARVFFLFEEAHWFYLDFIRAINPYLPLLKLKAFSKKLIELFPLIWKGGDPEEGLKEFSEYKQSIPVRGAALFNSSLNKILLVKGVESPKWSFPRGKISKDEKDSACAVREVKEEIGFDIAPYINEEDYIERNIKAKNYKIYLVKNIPDEELFQPLVRNEIAEIKWFDFKKNVCKKTNAQNFFLVSGMISPMITWIKKNRGEIDETKLKLDAENQLKFLLGIGQDEPIIDPGRELLDFIRKSSANKQLKDHQQQQLQFQQFQQFQQQYLQQQQYQQQHPLFPQIPFPAYGFQPAPMHLPFVNPFVPPHIAFPPPPPPVSYPQVPANNGMLLTNGILPPQPQQQQQQQPQPQPQQQHLAHKNQEQSEELLSILNNNPKKEKGTNAKELLNLFNKNKNGEPSDASKPKVTLLKRGQELVDLNGSGKTKDYSKDLLSLLNKSKEKKTGEEKTDAVKEQRKVNEVKPKLQLLNRNEETKAVDKEPVNGSEKNHDKPKTPPPNKELLQLIQQSKNESDVEIFEDFSDEDYDSVESTVDEQDAETDDINPADFTIDEEYKSDEDEFTKTVPDNSENNIDEEFILKSSEKSPRVQAPTQAPAQLPQQAPKKFKLLKRGEELDSFTNHKESVQEQHSSDGDDADDSGTSTIQFSDDSEGELNHSEKEAETESHSTKADELSSISQGPQSTGSASSSSYATPTCDSSKSVSEPSKADKHQEPKQRSNPLLDLLRKSSTSPDVKQDPTTQISSFNESASNELLSILHNEQPAPVQQQPAHTEVDNRTSSPSNDLLNLLKKKPNQEAVPPPQLPKPQLVHPQAQESVTNSTGNEFLSILHGKKENPSASNTLLSLLHRSDPSQHQSQTKVVQPPKQQYGTPATDLLNLLHRQE